MLTLRNHIQRAATQRCAEMVGLYIYAYVIYLLGLTPCALNGLPHHGIQEESQKFGLEQQFFDVEHHIEQVARDF